MRDFDEFLSRCSGGDYEKTITTKRLGDITIKAMTPGQYQQYNNRAQKRDNRGRPAGFDYHKYSVIVVAGQVVDPDFSSAEFLKKAGCTTAEDFVRKHLLPGEIAEIYERISEISGFDYNAGEFEDAIDEAKNS